MQSRLAEIRIKLDRLRTADEKRRVFGARREGEHGHDYRERPILDASQISALETACGAELPEEARAFLRCVHGGGAGPGYGLDIWGEPSRAARPFPYGRADLATLIARRQTDRFASLPMLDEGDASWPPGTGFIPLAHLGCGVYDVIVVTGELRGSVWCCDMAWRPHTRDERACGFLDWYEGWLDSSLTPRSLR